MPDYAESTPLQLICRGLDGARCGIVLLLLALRIGEVRPATLFQIESSAYCRTPAGSQFLKLCAWWRRQRVPTLWSAVQRFAQSCDDRTMPHHSQESISLSAHF